jgi:hypothetical protein
MLEPLGIRGAHATQQAVLGILQDFQHSPLEAAASLWGHDSELGQQPANLIALRCGCTDKSLPRPVQTQQRLLLDRFERDKSHVGSSDCLADRFRIPRIVLVALHLRLHELRRHQFDRVTERAELARPEMSATTGFQPHR